MRVGAPPPARYKSVSSSPVSPSPRAQGDAIPAADGNAAARRPRARAPTLPAAVPAGNRTAADARSRRPACLRSQWALAGVLEEAEDGFSVGRYSARMGRLCKATAGGAHAVPSADSSHVTLTHDVLIPTTESERSHLPDPPARYQFNPRSPSVLCEPYLRLFPSCTGSVVWCLLSQA